ncbi:MAG: phosphonate ABC transporter, permease protein PhnE [Candidatus Accumulibacter sp.]|nr:phosphonate ABC transporter, permease protein PhnE [Accumulibacter sp.]
MSNVSSASEAPGMAAVSAVWRRHTLRQKLARTGLWLLIAAAVAASLGGIEVIWEFLWDAPEQMADMVWRMWPPDLAYYPREVHTALMETFHIATVGTIFSMVFALPLAILAAHNLTPNKALNLFAKTCLVASRSVNSLVWALLFVAIFGPGPIAGTVAIAFRSVGFVGKLLGEALEEVHFGAIEALKAAGATQTSQILYGYWPAVKPAFWSIMLLRWDINIRESSVLGLVGAGGLGMIMNAAIDTFQWGRVATILLTIFAVVVIVEVVVTFFRRRLI